MFRRNFIAKLLLFYAFISISNLSKGKRALSLANSINYGLIDIVNAEWRTLYVTKLFKEKQTNPMYFLYVSFRNVSFFLIYLTYFNILELPRAIALKICLLIRGRFVFFYPTLSIGFFILFFSLINYLILYLSLNPEYHTYT